MKYDGAAQRTIQVTGTPRQAFSDPSRAGYLSVEEFLTSAETGRTKNGVRIAIAVSGGGWAIFWFDRTQDVYDLIATLEEALHRVPLVTLGGG